MKCFTIGMKENPQTFYEKYRLKTEQKILNNKTMLGIFIHTWYLNDAIHQISKIFNLVYVCEHVINVEVLIGTTIKPRLTKGKKQLKYLKHNESRLGKFNTRKEARESGESKFGQMDGRTESVKWCCVVLKVNKRKGFINNHFWPNIERTERKREKKF